MQATGECPPRMSSRWKARSWSGKPGDGERVGGRHWPVGGGESIASAAPAEPPSGARLAACCSGRLDPAVLDAIGSENVRTPVNNAHLVCRLLLEQQNDTQ